MAGQLMVVVHQHNILKKSSSLYSVAKYQPKPAQVLTEKCYACDAMHQTAAILNPTTYYNPVVAANAVYQVGDYNFVSISLILASGRAPPVSSVYC